MSFDLQGIQQKELVEIMSKLLEKNQQLEKERISMIEEVKKKVQHSGHTLMRRFDTFGHSKPMPILQEEV